MGRIFSSNRVHAGLLASAIGITFLGVGPADHAALIARYQFNVLNDGVERITGSTSP
jgi:hypothetical protein